MKNYLVLNGKDAITIKRETFEDAVEFAENFCNHSEEVIVREIDKVIVNDSDFIELVSNIADTTTRWCFGADTMNKSGDGYSEDAQDFFNGTYDDTESMINSFLNVHIH